MTVQISKKLKGLDPEKLLRLQQETEKKYGLRPHKRLRPLFLYAQVDTAPDELPSEDLGAMYQ